MQSVDIALDSSRKADPTFTVLSRSDRYDASGVPITHTTYRKTLPSGTDIVGPLDFTQKGNTIFRVSYGIPLNIDKTTQQFANYLIGTFNVVGTLPPLAQNSVPITSSLTPSTSSSMSAMNSINKNWANFNNDEAKILDKHEAERHQNCDYGPSNLC